MKRDIKGKTILLVEDEEMAALSTRLVLEKRGYQVLIAGTGEAAVEEIETNREVNLVLMDIVLGQGLDGTEAAKRILQHREIPIIFCSSHTEAETVEKTENITSYGYIDKSSGSEVLLASIRIAFQLFEARNSYKNTFSYSLNGICIHRKLYDPSGQLADCEYLNVNPAFHEHTGLSSEEVIGKTVRQIYPQGEADGVIALYDEVLRTARAAVRQFYFEPSSSWFQLSIYPMEGELFSVVIQNITEQKNAAAEAEEAKKRYRDLAENVEAILWEYDIRSDRWTYVAPQVKRILGYDPGEWKDLAFWVSHIHPEDQNWATSYCKECTAKGLAHQFEYRFRRKDGSYIWIRDVVSVIMEGESPAGLRGFMIDVTQVKEAEQALGKQLKEKELLLRETMHRIKNNIFSIESLLNLQADSAPNEDARSALRQAMSRVSGIRQLYEQMLSAANSDSVNLKEYLDPLVDQIVFLFPQAGSITLIKEIEPIKLGSRLLFPVGIMVNELLTNTMKYAFNGSAGGKIHVRSNNENGSILISVCDDGKGFPEEVLQGKTSGFGTNLVKMLAQQLNGTATLYNQCGGCAEIRFPFQSSSTQGNDTNA